MKRRRSATMEIINPKSSALGDLNGAPIQLPLDTDGASTQVHPGVLLMDGCEVVRNRGTVLCRLPVVEELSLNEAERFQDVDFNDRFPDEILQNIFKYRWRAKECWNLAKVCKRWYSLQASTLLQKRSSHLIGHYPCNGSQSACRNDLCNGHSKVLKAKKVESEWRLSIDLLNSCKRHTHQLEIKDCTHVSVRGYQLIVAFASNLKSIRLESCTSMDDPIFETLLDRCPSLRSIHVSMVPKLALRTIEKKALKLQELHVYGCPTATVTTVLSVLKVCPNLRSLGFSALGVSRDWEESKIEHVPPYRLQHLELANTLAVTDGFLQAFAKRLSNLRRLDLSHCLSVSDDGLMAIIASCGSRLQRLVVTRCSGISDDSARALAGVAANLQDVSLAGTSVGDEGLKALMNSTRVVTKLRNFSVACCHRLTDAGLQHLASKQMHMVSFRTLDVQGCPNVSMFALETLRNSMVNDWKIVSDRR